MRPLIGNSIWMRDVAHGYLKEDGFASFSEAVYTAIAEKQAYKMCLLPFDIGTHTKVRQYDPSR